MKITLPKPGTRGEYKLLFSNIGQENPNEFYLLMIFHKSRKGGFSADVTVSECQKALKRKNRNYVLGKLSK
ncbi:MAG: hypothetical protein AAB649_00705 [Patescibacteria group bacterium]